MRLAFPPPPKKGGKPPRCQCKQICFYMSNNESKSSSHIKQKNLTRYKKRGTQALAKKNNKKTKQKKETCKPQHYSKG